MGVPTYQFYVIEYQHVISHVGFEEYLTLENLMQELHMAELDRWKIIFPASKLDALDVVFKVALEKTLPPIRAANDKEILSFIHRQVQ